MQLTCLIYLFDHVIEHFGTLSGELFKVDSDAAEHIFGEVE